MKIRNIYKIREVNYINSFKHKITFARHRIVSSINNFPPIILFNGRNGIDLLLNDDYTRHSEVFNINNMPHKIIVDRNIENAAIALKNAAEFNQRKLLTFTDCFTFIFDNRSHYFMIADIDIGISHRSLGVGFNVLRTYHYISPDAGIMMKGVFETNMDGHIETVVATFHNPETGLAQNNALIRGSFLELGLGLRLLGCSEETPFLDLASPATTLQRYLKHNDISILGDVLNKFAPLKP